MAEFAITLSNEKIWKFYNEHPSINAESINLFFIELMENSTKESDSIININNHQIIDHLKNIQIQINKINDTLSQKENESKNNSRLMEEFKKDYVKTYNEIQKQNEINKYNIMIQQNNEKNKTTNQHVQDVLNRWSTL
jgi:hypothetical protein